MRPDNPLYEHACALRDAMQDAGLTQEDRVEYGLSRHTYRHLRHLIRRRKLTVNDIPSWMIAKTYIT